MLARRLSNNRRKERARWERNRKSKGCKDRLGKRSLMIRIVKRVWFWLQDFTFGWDLRLFGLSDSFRRTWPSILFIHTSKKPKLPTLKKKEQAGQRMPTSQMATISLRLIRGSHGATGESKNDCPKAVKKHTQGGANLLIFNSTTNFSPVA